MDKLQLEVLLKAIDQATAPIKSIRESSSETAKALRDAKSAMKDLEQQQGLVDKFRDTSKWVAITGNQLQSAQEKVRELKLEMEATDAPTRKMARAFEAAREEAADLKEKHGELIAKQQTLRTALGEAGIDTANLADHQRRLKTEISAATGEVDRQTVALGIQNEKLRVINAAQANYRKTLEFRNRLATGGAVTMATGAAIGAPFLASAKEYSSFEDAMMGVAKQMEGARDANGQYTDSYREMARAIKAMSEEIPMVAKDIAAIVEAAARMGIQGKANLLNFAKETALMSSALDLPVEDTGKNMATIAGLYKIPIPRIKELGDTINWLDDSSKTSSADIIEVMKRIGGTADMLKMNFRDAAAIGTTFLDLGAGAEVAASASNAMMRELSIATMQGKRFQVGLHDLGLDAKALQQAMGQDATGTILKVLEAIRALPDEKRLESATRLFGKEFGDDAAKLAMNVDEYRKFLRLARKDGGGQGTVAKEMDAQIKSLSAQKALMDNTLTNLSSDIGESIKGPLVSVLHGIRDILHAARDWVAAHPDLLIRPTNSFMRHI